MTVPYSFGTATTAIPLSQLDSNFNTPITLGNTAIQLGNTVTTLNNMTLANVAITSVATTFPNNYLANSSITIGSTSISLGSTASTVAGLTLTSPTTATPTRAMKAHQSRRSGTTAAPMANPAICWKAWAIAKAANWSNASAGSGSPPATSNFPPATRSAWMRLPAASSTWPPRPGTRMLPYCVDWIFSNQFLAGVPTWPCCSNTRSPCSGWPIWSVPPAGRPIS